MHVKVVNVQFPVGYALYGEPDWDWFIDEETQWTVTDLRDDIARDIGVPPDNLAILGLPADNSEAYAHLNEGQIVVTEIV